MTVTMISENIKRIKEKITNAALKAERSPKDIKLVAVLIQVSSGQPELTGRYLNGPDFF